MSSSEAADTLVSKFTQATAPYQARLLRIARALCRDADQAADLTQEALVRAFRAFESFRQDQPIFPWLCRILRNVHLDSFKTGRARHERVGRELPAAPEDPYHNLPSSTPDPLRRLEQGWLRECLQQEVEALEPSQRIVLLLCDVEEMSYEEAAEIAGIPVGTVRSRLARGRARLRARLCTRLQVSESSELFAVDR